MPPFPYSQVAACPNHRPERHRRLVPSLRGTLGRTKEKSGPHADRARDGTVSIAPSTLGFFHYSFRGGRYSRAVKELGLRGGRIHEAACASRETAARGICSEYVRIGAGRAPRNGLAGCRKRSTGRPGSRKRPGRSAPPARFAAAMGYNEETGETVLFGGADADCDVMNDTWTWDGERWTGQDARPIPADSPAPRQYGRIAYAGPRKGMPAVRRREPGLGR